MSFEIAADDWRRLLSFSEEVERLRSTRFVQERMGGQISLSFRAGEGFRSESKAVDSEAVAAMLLRLRPFVLAREEHYFHKVKNLLRRRLAHRAFREHIDQIDDAFCLKTMSEVVRVSGATRPLLSVEVVMDWLNSYEYHRDKKKRQAIEEDLGLFGKNQNGLPVILFALVDMVEAVLGLGNLVTVLIRIEKGDIQELPCIPSLLQ